MPLLLCAAPEHHAAFGPHAREQVYDAEIGKETSLPGKHLPIGCRSEGNVGGMGNFWRHHRAKVYDGIVFAVLRADIGRGLLNGAVQGKKTEDGLMKSLVEIGQKRELPFVKCGKVVGVVKEVRTVLVGRHESRKVLVPPVAVVGEPNVAHGGVRSIVANDGHGKRKRTRGRSYVATVAVGLLDEMLVAVLHYAVSGIDVGIELYGTKICGGNKKGLQGEKEVEVKGRN